MLVNGCFLCKVEEESIDHILFHCSKTIFGSCSSLCLVFLSVVYYSDRDSLRVAWIFCGKKMKEGSESYSFIHFLYSLE